MSLTKPTAPTVALPANFGGTKTEFSPSQLSAGYAEGIAQILAGDNLNYFLDVLFQNSTYFKTIIDFINACPIGQVISVDSNNKLTYIDSSVQPDWNSTSGLAQILNKPDLDPDIISLGNKSINFTLTENRIHIANITGSCTLSLPTISTTTKYVDCMIEFSLASGQSLTLPTVKWDWDYVPTFSTTVKNLILFRTTDNGTTWRASYKQGGA